MPEFYAEPPFERIAVEFLLAAPAIPPLVSTDSLGPMVGTSLRSTWDDSKTALRIRRIGGLPTEQSARHLVRGRLQVDAFAPARDEEAAEYLARTADLVLRALAGTTRAGYVVTAVERDLAMRNEPDPDSDAARFVFGVILYAHGAPE